jgi:hypothetical protein
MNGNYTQGPWKWDRHILNSNWNTEDGSKMDYQSVVMMLSYGAKNRMLGGDAALIEKAPEMYNALQEICDFVQNATYDDDGIIESIENTVSSLLSSI